MFSFFDVWPTRVANCKVSFSDVHGQDLTSWKSSSLSSTCFKWQSRWTSVEKEDENKLIFLLRRNLKDLWYFGMLLFSDAWEIFPRVLQMVHIREV